MNTPNDGLNQRQIGPRDWAVSAEVEALEDAETHFTPPRPPRVLGNATDPVRRLGTMLTVAGPLFAILALILRAAYGATALIVGLLSFGTVALIAGLLISLWKLPAHSDNSRHDDADADGAVL